MRTAPSILPIPPAPVPDPLNPRLIGAAVLVTALVDILLWHQEAGATAIALIIALLAAVFGGSKGRPTRRLCILMTLAVASAGQALLELKPSTFAVSAVLLLALVGEAHFAQLSSRIAGWIEVGFAFIFPYPAWRRLECVFRRRPRASEEATPADSGVWRLLQIVLPALLLCGIFSAIFAGGNAIFASFSAHLFEGFYEWIGRLDFSPSRLFFWAAIFTLLLSLLRPLRTGIGEWIGRRSLPRWQRRDEALGRWQSIAVLGVLNALFFSVNTIDSIYLWRRATLPEAVNPSAFLHDGVENLILAVILSAVVLVILFQQRLAIHSRVLQWLATVWVAQNVVLIAGVFLRLKLYVEELQLTLLRVGVGLFLVLVIAGFGLLTVYLWQGRNLGWLLRANAIATFVLFFVVQFCDVSGAIARYNVGRYLHESGRFPDVEYLGSLGDAAWPSLLELAQRKPHSRELDEQLASAHWKAADTLRQTNWRQWERLPRRRSEAVVQFLQPPSAAR